MANRGETTTSSHVSPIASANTSEGEDEVVSEEEEETRKRSRASEELDDVIDSSSSAPSPSREPVAAVPLQVKPPARPAKKLCADPWLIPSS